MRPTTAFGLCLLAAGCATPRRGPNVMMMVAAEVAPVTAEVGGEAELGVAGGVHGSAQLAETDDDWLSVRGRLDLGIGGDRAGAAGHASLDAQAGLAFFDGADHLFVRAGILAVAEADSLTGLYLLELPAIFFGYQHHGHEIDDEWHLDVGPRVALDVVGHALARGGISTAGTLDVVAAPGVGGAIVMMGPLVTFELSYEHVFADGAIDLVRGSACVAALVALCLDTRHVVAPFSGMPGVTAYYGVRLGVGLATGHQL